MRREAQQPSVAAALGDEGRAPRLCVEGRNCWRIARAARVAVLIDGQAYFDAFVEAARRARHSILVIGWDIAAATRLSPHAMPDGPPATLREFLQMLLARRPGLHARLLDWDFSLVFALERELLPALRHGWLTHPRLDFRLDGEHPVAGSQHQKIVVIDDAIAFVGGLDLTVNRWDTPAHRIDDPQRVGPDGTRYGPFHDVQIAVDGAAARALGALARERWRRATGERVACAPGGVEVWPPGLAPDLSDVEVAIARTDPAHDGRAAVREVEALYLDAIAAARRWIYCENQYFTSTVIADAFAQRLREANGPEIVLVMPLTCSGWLEEGSMGVARGRLLRRLQAADVHHRLRCYYPRLRADTGCPTLNVHSKVMVVDDALVRVASSNLSNRSMGLDSECDLAIEGDGSPRTAAAIAAVRDRLVAEHLGVAPETVASSLARTGSLATTIERLGDGERTLVSLCVEDGDVMLALPELPLVDLERPVEHAPILVRLLPRRWRESLVLAASRALPALVGLALVLALWRWAGASGWRGPLAWAAPLAAATGFVVGTGLAVPTGLLTALCILVLGPAAGALSALAGTLLSAAAGYGVGRVLSPPRFLQLAGRYLERVSWRLRDPTVAAVAALRLLPVAPFMAVNLVAGARRVPAGRYLVGTLLGALPGIAAVVAVAYAILP